MARYQESVTHLHTNPFLLNNDLKLCMIKAFISTMILAFFLFIIPLALAFPQLLPPSPTKSLTNYKSIYSNYCAESTFAVDTYTSSRVQWAAYTEYTNVVSRTWTTIYPSPTPTSFPTTVLLTHISSATNENWVTLSNGQVNYASVEMVVVSFTYEKELKTRPTALAVPNVEGGCRRVG